MNRQELNQLQDKILGEIAVLAANYPQYDGEDGVAEAALLSAVRTVKATFDRERIALLDAEVQDAKRRPKTKVRS